MRVVRIAKVGLGVMLACALAGAVAGMLCDLILEMIMFGPRSLFSDVSFTEAAATIGGLCGLVVGPIAAFGFLRRAPLGRLFVETSLGATLGSVLGFALGWHTPYRIVTIVGTGVLGFAVAVAHLVWRYRAPRAQTTTSLPASQHVR